MGKGVVPEIIIIATLAASMIILGAVFIGSHETPSVIRATTDALNNLRDIVAKGILDWLNSDPVDHFIVCNGLYNIGEDNLTYGLNERISSLLDGITINDGPVTVKPGEFRGAYFDGFDTLVVSLENGTILYDSNDIESIDELPQDFFFNVRLPLVLSVVKDWHSCDSGNITKNLADILSVYCFFGVKDDEYPGGCIGKKKYRISADDVDFMSATAPNTADVSKAVSKSVDFLNDEFKGIASCQNNPLSKDSGISCSYKIQDLTFDYYVAPWSSEMLPKDMYKSDISDESIYYQLEQFRDSDEHVWALKPNVTIATYSDNELGCPDEGRTPVNDYFSMPLDDEMVPLNDPPTEPNSPVMYVNTTKGVAFNLVLECTDNRFSILGQPLKYDFKSRHSIKIKCTPGFDMINGNYMCNGCGLKPGLNLESCVSPGKPAPCTRYFDVCTKTTLWLIFIDESESFHTFVDWEQEGWNYQPGWTYEEILSNNEDTGLLDYLASDLACQTVYINGRYWDRNKYPPPVDEKTHQITCDTAYITDCCAVPGYKEDCSPVLDPTNTECQINQGMYLGMCTSPLDCGSVEWSRGDVCYNIKCDPEANKCVENRDDIAYGDDCDDGCYTCSTSTGVCELDADKIGNSCGESTACADYECTENGCERVPKNEGGTCTIPGQSICRSYTCQSGWCSPGGPQNDGSICGSETIIKNGKTCTYMKKCDNGSCILDQSTEECSGGDSGGCPPECPPTSDGSCSC